MWGHRSKQIQRSLTPKCRQATVRKPWTRIIGKCSPQHGHLLSRLRLRRTPLVRWFHVGVGHMDDGRAQSLSKPKSWSYVSDNWCLPRNGLALLWVGVFWNSSPVNAVSGPPGENVRLSSLNHRDNAFQPRRNQNYKLPAENADSWAGWFYLVWIRG